MEPRHPEIDALQRVAIALVLGRVMERLLAFLPSVGASRALEPEPMLAPEPASNPTPGLEPRPEDLAVQAAIDEVLEYHRTHRPKNTTKNYGPKQKEWKVSSTSPFRASLLD
jgi:hypothetical protein